jgi:hypothetical protein
VNARGDDGYGFGWTPAGDERGGEDLEEIRNERHRREDADFGLRENVGLGDERGDENIYRQRHRDDRHGDEAVGRAEPEAAGEVSFALGGVGAGGGCVHDGLARNQAAWSR